MEEIENALKEAEPGALFWLLQHLNAAAFANPHGALVRKRYRRPAAVASAQFVTRFEQVIRGLERSLVPTHRTRTFDCNNSIRFYQPHRPRRHLLCVQQSRRAEK